MQKRSLNSSAVINSPRPNVQSDYQHHRIKTLSKQASIKIIAKNKIKLNFKTPGPNTLHQN